MTKFSKIALLICSVMLLTLGSMDCFASIEPYTNSIIGPFTANHTFFSNKDEKFMNSNYTWSNITNSVVQDGVTLRVRDSVLLTYAFTSTVGVKIKYYTSPDTISVPATVVNTTLTVNYVPGQGATYKGIDTYNFTGAYRIDVTVTSINSNLAPPDAALQLSSSIIIDRKYLFQPTAAITPTYAYGQDSTQMKSSWGGVSGAEEYDIEWTTINNGNSNYSVIDTRYTHPSNTDNTNVTAALNKIFRNNASRVTTPANTYTLSVISSDTYLVMRVRQVQYLTNGVRETGNWNYMQSGGTLFAIFKIKWHQQTLNWQYSSAYAEEGKKKEVVSYFDGSLRGRQTVTLNNTDNIALAQENIYDQFGRATASILPAPFVDPSGTPYLHYVSSFNKNASGTIYNYADLTAGTYCELNPDPLGTTTGASRYYSNQSDFYNHGSITTARPYNSFIPDAAGYPLSVTEYTADNTGRIKDQGGVGLAFQPGKAVSPDISRTTKYFYGKPEQYELDQLFGSDVGFAEHYLKNMVVDPNGQISVSYINASGKTIATALSGAAPTTMDALPAYTAPSTKAINLHVLKPEQFTYNATDMTLSASTTYLNAVIDTGRLYYNIQKIIDKYPGGNFAVCSNCYYNMTVTVTNDCGDVVASTTTPVQVGSSTSNCADSALYKNNIAVNFTQIGAYFITIKFAFDKNIIQNFTDNFISQGIRSGYIQQQANFIKTRYLDNINLASCYSDCHTCSVALGSQADFVQKIKNTLTATDMDAASVNSTSFNDWAIALYQRMRDSCAAKQSACQYNPCESVQDEMEQDVSPGGQYALFDSNYNPVEPAINVLSEKNIINPSVTNWRYEFPVYASTDSIYKSDLVTLNDSTVTSPYSSTFTLQQLVQYWKPEWAERFLKYHPEYCKLQFCNEMSSYETWDDQVQQIAYADQVATIPGASSLSYSYNNAPNWLLTEDPLFKTGAPGAAYYTQMSNDLSSYSKSVLAIPDSLGLVKNIMQLVDFDLYCNVQAGSTTNTPPSSDVWNNCTPNPACRVPDREWAAYKNYYFELKQKYYTIMRNASCGTLCPVGQSPTYTLAPSTAQESDFHIQADTGSTSACVGKQSVVIQRAMAGDSATIHLYYPPVYDNASLTHSVYFAATDVRKTFCLPDSIPVSAVLISGIGSKSNSNAGTTPSNVYVVITDGSAQTETLTCATTGASNSVTLHTTKVSLVDASGNPTTSTQPVSVTLNYNLVYPDGQYANRTYPATVSIDAGASSNTTTYFYLGYLDYGQGVGCVRANTTLSCINNINGAKLLTTGSGFKTTCTGYTQSTNCSATPDTAEVVYVDALASQYTSNCTSSSGAASPKTFITHSIRFSLVHSSNGYPDTAKQQVTISFNLHTTRTGAGGTSPYTDEVETVVINAGSTQSDLYLYPYESWETDPVAGCDEYDARITCIKQIIGAKLSYQSGQGQNVLPTCTGYKDSLLTVTPACGGNTSCPVAYANKVSRFTDYTGTSGGKITSDSLQKAYASNAALVKSWTTDICTSDANALITALTPGLNALGTTPANRTSLLNDLIQICTLGTDSAHTNGVSDLTGSPAGNSLTYKSFGAAIKGRTGISNYTMALNPWIIDGPSPYLTQPQSTAKTISTSNPNLCAMMAVLTQHAAAAYMSVYDYMVYTYKDAMTLSKADVDALQNSCGNCRFILAKDITLPVFLDPGSKGCIHSAEFKTVTDSMTTVFGGTIDTTNVNYQKIYTNFLNQRWGFALGYDDYAVYRAKVKTDTTVMLCNAEPFQPVAIDSSSCMEDALTQAVDNGKADYQNYIDTLRSRFQTNYINTCSAAQANANLTAKQQTYHYTLYYYDQADNLVRTIPPAGVTLLDSGKFAVVDTTRVHESQRDCQVLFDGFSSSIVTGQKSTALTSLSSRITAGVGAVEFWLYNPTSSVHHFIEETPDQAHMFNICISGTQINVDIYSSAASATGGVKYTLSNQFSANIATFMPLKPWVHLVIQSSNLASAALSVYLNGSPLTPYSTVQPCNCSFTITGGSTAPVYPDSMVTVKHMRIYNRLMTAAEVYTNANDDCLIPSSSAGLLSWYRFNVPAAGDSTTVAGNSTDESRLKHYYPLHTLPTGYVYNSTNQVSQQQSPDGGTNRYWYDLLSRLIASQNDKQLPGNNYSYTTFDALGRITEVGQKTQTTVNISTPHYLPADTAALLLAAGSNSQITHTYYDAPVPTVANNSNGIATLPQQSNLRKRVVASTYADTQTGPVLNATYYNYDIDGNVKTLWQQVNGLYTASTNKGLKRIDYEYDLVSGKTNFVRYQDGQPDRFYYKYSYDADNRLTEAWSGTRAMTDTLTGSTLIPDNKRMDAQYYYYLHGPLARMELGDVYGKVQGVDYAYTLQGWLKGVNSGQGIDTRDMGKDSLPIARDAYAYALYYYGNASTTDYTPIGGTNPFETSASGFSTFSPLYNGNIAAASMNLPQLTDPWHYYTYRYDQLNRLTRTDVYKATGTAYNVTYVNDYKEFFGYDPNGNITTVNRYANAGTQMDNMVYHYNTDASGKLTNNRLNYIADAVASSAYPNDIDNQGANNYTYDAIGDLTADVGANVSGINWSVYGKIQSLTNSSGTISYSYDAAGQRVTKASGGITTYYVRDAQGNTLATYNNAHSAINWMEQDLYGSSRLGMWQPAVKLGTDSSYIKWDTVGKKAYELTNHLGNVLATITDKRLGTGTGTTVNYFKPDVATEQEYYPFGGLMPSRTYTQVGSYRYGFNGKENDNDVKGTGNEQDYGMRIYDPRVGRFLSVDPLFKKYPYLTPYQFSSNTPIQATDLDGLEADYSKAKSNIEEYNKADNAVDVQSKFVTNVVSYAYNGVVDIAEYLSNINPIYNLVDKGRGVQKVYNSFKKTASNALDYLVWTDPMKMQNDQFNFVTNPHTWEQATSMFLTEKISSFDFEIPKFKYSFTTTDGFLVKGFNVKAPFDIPVQRFGNMSLTRSDYWGLKLGTNESVNRIFNAIKVEWNPLEQYTTGVIPKGTPMKVGIVGPQGWQYPGGSFQFILDSKTVTDQSSKAIKR